MITPESNGSPQVIRQPTAQTKVAVLYKNDNVPRLSAAQKLRLAHRGFKEVTQEWDETPSYELVEEGSSSTYKYVAGDARPELPVADTDDGIVITNNGTFTDNVYDGNASSSSSNDGLVGPLNTAHAADAENPIILDLPGRNANNPITADNALSIAGHPVDVSETFETIFSTIQGYAVGNSATAMTIAMLVKLGLNEVLTANLAAYKVAVAAATTIDTIGDLQQIIKTVNAAA